MSMAMRISSAENPAFVSMAKLHSVSPGAQAREGRTSEAITIHEMWRVHSISTIEPVSEDASSLGPQSAF